MRFLVDECTGPEVAQWLREHQHNVFSVYDEARGLSDEEVILKAYNDNRILITNDKDFGRKIYRENHPHQGVILLRLENERVKNKTSVIQQLLDNFGNTLENKFVVVTEKRVRFAKN